MCSSLMAIDNNAYQGALTLALTREQKRRFAPLLRVGVERVVERQCRSLNPVSTHMP